MMENKLFTILTVVTYHECFFLIGHLSKLHPQFYEMHLWTGLWMSFFRTHGIHLSCHTHLYHWTNAKGLHRKYFSTFVTHTHTLTQWHRGAHDQKKWELSVESWQCPDLAQCREILILRGCSLWPALFSWSGILLIVQVTETEAAGLKRTSVGGNNGLSQPINVSCSASAHWLFASPPSRVLSDQPLSLTA